MGEDNVGKRVVEEPSGNPFNTGAVRVWEWAFHDNPFINSGALVVSDNEVIPRFASPH